MANAFELWAKNLKAKIKRKDWSNKYYIFWKDKTLKYESGASWYMPEFNFLDDDWEEWEEIKQTLDEKLKIILSGDRFMLSGDSCLVYFTKNGKLFESTGPSEVRFNNLLENTITKVED